MTTKKKTPADATTKTKVVRRPAAAAKKPRPKSKVTARTAPAKKAKIDTKANQPINPPEPPPNTPPVLGAWTFYEGEQGWTGHKVFEAGVIREVAGKTLEDAETCATELDRIVGAREQGRAEQNAARADRARDHANKIEAGLA